MTETSDAISLVFDVPASLAEAFTYEAGQFVTLRVEIDGEPFFRSYSMSSSPATDADLQVTIKRVPGGVVSNLLNDTVREGDLIDTALRELDVDEARINIERFTPLGAAPTDFDTTVEPIKVTVTVRGQTKTVDQRGRSTILQSARWGGLPAPSSCEAGHCATCMARVVEGRVEMATNDALSVEEVSEGWVLTCQAVPVPPGVRAAYASCGAFDGEV